MRLSSLRHLPKGEIKFISCISSCCMIQIKHGGGFCDLDHDFSLHKTLSYNFHIWVSQLTSIDSIPIWNFIVKKVVTLCSFLTFNQVTERNSILLKVALMKAIVYLHTDFDYKLLYQALNIQMPKWHLYILRILYSLTWCIVGIQYLPLNGSISKLPLVFLTLINGIIHAVSQIKNSRFRVFPHSRARYLLIHFLNIFLLHPHGCHCLHSDLYNFFSEIFQWFSLVSLLGLPSNSFSRVT